MSIYDCGLEAFIENLFKDKKTKEVENLLNKKPELVNNLIIISELIRFKERDVDKKSHDDENYKFHYRDMYNTIGSIDWCFRYLIRISNKKSKEFANFSQEFDTNKKKIEDNIKWCNKSCDYFNSFINKCISEVKTIDEETKIKKISIIFKNKTSFKYNVDEMTKAISEEYNIDFVKNIKNGLNDLFKTNDNENDLFIKIMNLYKNNKSQINNIVDKIIKITNLFTPYFKKYDENF